MLQAILDMGAASHKAAGSCSTATYHTSLKLSKLDELDTLDTAGEVGTYFCGPLHMDEQRQDELLEPTYSSPEPI